MCPHLREAVTHALVLQILSETITLHLALDHIERVTADPQHFSCETTISGNLPCSNVLALDVVARSVRVHQVLEGGEPYTVGLCFTQESNCSSAVQTTEDTLVCGDLAYAVDGPVVQTSGSTGLGLQADTDVLDGRRKDGVGNTGKGAGSVVLRV